jgi:cyclic pyranopterin phosphate synthase
VETPRIVPIVDHRTVRPDRSARRISLPLATAPLSNGLDALGRGVHDLRISVTDRCNFRCTYCMPKEVFDRDHSYLPHKDLLTFEEIERVTRVFARLGVEKIRLTGGEPLLRKDLEVLIEKLATIEHPRDPTRRIDLTLTTNGSLLRKKAAALKRAGLGRVTVSLDALDDARFRAMNDVDFPVAAVLDGIDAAAEAGLGPIKVNMVVKRGTNDDQILPMVEHFRHSGHILRLIEFMDVGTTNGWRLDDVVSSDEVISRIHSSYPLDPLEANYSGEVAERWRFRDGAGEIGVISSVTHAFCGTCTRARLSPEGALYTCLFAGRGHDLRTLIRSDATDEELAGAISTIWSDRADRYSELRSSATVGAVPRIEMSYIGG